MSRTSPTSCPAEEASAVEVAQGEGWRLVIDPARQPYIALVGGEDWATELTREELQILSEAIERLRQQHGALVDQLLDEEDLELELELPLAGAAGANLWMALKGDRRRWSLRFVLTPAAGVRAFEGAWSAAASAALSASLEGLALKATIGFSPS